MEESRQVMDRYYRMAKRIVKAMSCEGCGDCSKCPAQGRNFVEDCKCTFCQTFYTDAQALEYFRNYIEDYDTVNNWQTNEVSLQDDLFSALTMCLDALYEAVDIAPLDRLPTKAPAAIQQARYVLNKVDGGSR